MYDLILFISTIILKPQLQQPNNFNIIRLAAAAFVIFSHSFGFYGRRDPVYIFSNGKIPGGQFAVYVFFLLSGYLITSSWLKKEEIFPYLNKRVRRIFPALIVTVLISIFVVGPAFSNLPFLNYFSSSETYSYLWNISLWKMKLTLPGVFAYDGVEHTVNPPIWTLFFEFLMYIIIILFGLLKMFDRQKKSIYILWTFVLASLVLVLIKISPELFIFKIGVANFVRFFLFFFAGAIFFIYCKERKIPIVFPIVFFVLMCVLRNIDLFFVPAFIFIIAIVFRIAFHEQRYGQRIVSYGDFSYGTYLYGYIIQNIVFQLIGEKLNPWSLFIISLLLTVPLAILSWNIVEKKFLDKSSTAIKIISK